MPLRAPDFFFSEYMQHLKAPQVWNSRLQLSSTEEGAMTSSGNRLHQQAVSSASPAWTFSFEDLLLHVYHGQSLLQSDHTSELAGRSLPTVSSSKSLMGSLP